MKVLESNVPPPHQIRQELIDLFVRDILGPAGGADEEVAEARTSLSKTSEIRKNRKSRSLSGPRAGSR